MTNSVRAIECPDRDPMRLYVAAPFELARQADRLGRRLAEFDRGIHIVSRWAAACVELEIQAEPIHTEHRRRLLEDCLTDLDDCDVVVALTHDGMPRATAADIAYALAHSKPVVWLCGRCGEGRCLWDAHALVTLVPINDVTRGFLDIWAAIKKADGGDHHEALRS